MQKLPGMPPRFAHPNCGYHMHRNVMAGGYVFTAFAALLCVPYVGCLLYRQPMRLTKFVQSVFGVSLARHILQICRSIVMLVSVFMVHLPFRRARAYERMSDHPVKRFMRVFSVDRQRDKQVAVAAARGGQNACWRGFIRCAAKNFADYSLTDAYLRRYFSCAVAFAAHLPNAFNLSVRKSSLRDVLRPKTSHSAFVANFVCGFIPVYWQPSFHVNTSVS